MAKLIPLMIYLGYFDLVLLTSIILKRTMVQNKTPIRVLLNEEFSHCVYINVASIDSRNLGFIKFPKVLSTYHLDITSKEIVFHGDDVEDVLVLFYKTIFIHTNQRYEEDWISIDFQLFLFCSSHCLFHTDERLS